MTHDELSADEAETLHSGAYENVSDAQICREADLGDPVAYEIVESWSEERRQAAIRTVDMGYQP
jgi:predicted NBD/HSP70 family sugar kinase